MTTLKYILGNEHCEVIEHENFDDSIFASQYAQALKAIDRYLETEINDPKIWNKHQNDALRAIVFNGERGDGKSSCMRSVTLIIDSLYNDKDQTLSDKDKKFIENLNLHKLSHYKFEILPVIDPAFFDKNHNVLEFIIGQIYSRMLELKDNNDRILRNDLMTKFQEIKSAVSELYDKKQSGYDEIYDLSILAAAMRLRQLIEEMMRCYLKYIGKDRLILSIDDIDLNMECAYEMCEQLRKYLGNKYCIVLISVKLPQLLDAISNTMSKQLSDVKKGESYEMATKYIDKLLPSAIRIAMPKMYGLSDIKIEIYPNETSATSLYENATVKDGIVELIFQRTRYLFYNTLSGVSPIVPSNLREAMMLLGLLTSMPEISSDHSSAEETKKLNSNKLLFKEYFYTGWTQRLDADNRNEIYKWLKPENKTSQNKLIAQYIGSWTEYSNGERDYSENDETENEQKRATITNQFENIISKDNFGYNVSIGDVFHLIYLLEQDKLNSEQELMLFFIKSHYSIMLYEAYDKITESAQNRYPESNPEKSILYRFDERFSEINELQRLVGSYFTYEPNDLLPYDENTKVGYDLRGLNFKTDRKGLAKSKWRILLTQAHEYLLKISDHNIIKSEEDKEEWLKTIRIAEYLLLTISRTIPSGDDYNPLKSIFRKNVRPAYVHPFYSPMKVFLFDALMPFTSMINPKFAYNRFHSFYAKPEDINDGKDFYSLAIHTPGTLIREMMIKVNNDCSEDLKADRVINDEDYEDYLCSLLSDSIIRNGEVLAAIFANLKGKRFETKDKKGIEKIANLYLMIQKGGMATHRQSKYEKPYKLTFTFLSPIIKFLETIKDDREFLDIFNNDPNIPASEARDKARFLDYIKDYWATRKDGSYVTYRKSTIVHHFNDIWTGEFTLRSIMNHIESTKEIDSPHDYHVEEFANLMYEYSDFFEGYNEFEAD